MILRRLSQWLRNSPHFHVRQRGVQSLSDVIDLIDRFIDGNLRYPLEWDDFVSWDHSISQVEAVRDRIANTEPLFFSKDPAKVAEGVKMLLEERNRAALLLGRATRVGAGDAA